MAGNDECPTKTWRVRQGPLKGKMAAAAARRPGKTRPRQDAARGTGAALGAIGLIGLFGA
jgi:hypothetical protein